MNEAPLISCIMPVFNGERYIGEALDSILAQTYRPLEIIVVDDGSTDETPAVVARYADAVSCLSQPRAGAAAARNRGLAAARGEFVAFLDSDDVWLPEKLAVQIDCFRARPELELCIAHARKFWVPELDLERERLRAHPSSQEQPGYICQCLLARRGLFDRVGEFDVTLTIGEDTDWFLRAKDHGAVMEVVPQLLVFRRMHHDNLSYRIHDAAGIGDRFRIVRAALNRRRQRGAGKRT